MSEKLRKRRMTNTAGVHQKIGDGQPYFRAPISYLLLEQRMVFDGAAHDTAQAAADPAAPSSPPGAAHDAAGGPPPSDGAHAADTGHAASTSAPDHSAPPPAPAPEMPEVIKVFGELHAIDHNTTNSIVFIDASVRDADVLARNIAPGVTVVMLDPTRDGLQQIADYVHGHSDIDSLHIVSHGDAGELRLGNGFYNNANIDDFSATLAAIGSALSRDGDILLYGCDTANGVAGERFVTSISAMTGADIAASTNLTGRAADGGDWRLEFSSGSIESRLAISQEGQDSYGYLLNTAVNHGNGAMLVSAGNTLYSVDALTGKATAITTAPASIGGVSFGGPINSIAVDHANSLIYYVDSTINTNNRALFAFDYASNTHILIDSDLTNNGAGLSIAVGNAGVGGGGAAFASGTLYLGVENTSGTNDTIYRITFSANGRTITGANTLVASITGANDWGDLSVDAATNALLSLSATTLTRYDLTTGTVLTTTTTSTGGQSGTDINGNFYVIGTTVQQINPTTGVSIGTGVAITTNGSTALADVSDATRWVPQTGSIGDLIFNDKDSDGVVDADEGGLANVTVQLIDDVNNNGVVDANDRILATDTTNASGGYLFTNVLPGNYIVRVTDTNGALGGSSPTVGTAIRQIGFGGIGSSALTADIGYSRIAPIVDLNSTPTTVNPVTNGSFTGNATGWTLTGSSTFSTSVGSGGAVYWTTDASTGTLTQTGLTGFNSGPAPSGAAQVIFGFGWNNPLVDLGVPATLTISIGGVTYATVTTPSGAGPATIEYQNGASGSPATIASSTILAWTYTDITINLPSTVAASGNLVLTYNTPLLGGDDISVDNIRINAYADATAGRDWTATYTENGTPVAIAGPGSGIIDPDNTSMASATVVLTNKQASDRLRIGGVAGTILANGSSGTVNGIGYTVVDNGATVTIQLTGSATRAVYSDTIRSIVYENTGDAPSTTARVFNVTVSDGSQTSNTAISTISVTAVNDAPVNTLPGTYSFAEDGTLGLTGIQVSDADAGAGAIVVTLSVPAGTLTATSGGGVTIGGSGTGTLTLTGTLTSINTYLAGASRPSFVPVANFNGAVTLTMTTSDGGNTGTGGILTDTDTSTITVTAVNDAPVNTLPATYSVAEDGTLGLTGLQISDIDAAAGTMTVTLSVPAGSLTATAGGGVTVTGSGTSTLTLSGTLTALNAYLASAARPNFVPTSDFNGTVTLTMTTSDGGNTGTGGVLTDSDTSTITVTAVADAVNDSVTATEDTATLFNVLANDTFSNPSRLITAINGTAIAVNGTVAVTGGTLRLNGDGTLSYTPTADYNGNFSFTYTVTSGGVAETATVSVAVAAVNDAPTQTLPGAQTTGEDTARAITGVSVGDIDSSALTTTLTSTNGTLAVTAGGGAVITGNGTGSITITGSAAQINAALIGLTYTPLADFNGAATIAISTNDGALSTNGSIAVSVSPVADIVNDSVSTNEDTAGTFNVLANDTFSNPSRAITAINGVAIAVNGSVAVSNGSVRLNADWTLTFTPAANMNGSLSFTYTVTSGGVAETATVNVTVNAVNDAPAGTDKTIAIAEDGSYTFTAADFGFSDPNDTPANTLESVVITTLPLTGALTLNGVAVTQGQAIAAADIPNLRWTPPANANGAGLASFTFQVRDNGGTANSGQNTDQTPNTITFDVSAVNDAPVNTLPASYATNEDTSLALTGISVADVDAGSGPFTVTLSINTGGTLSATSGGGVTVTGSGTTSITLSGTLASINAYLGTTAPVFTPGADFNGPVTLTIVSNDGGGTGAGGPLSDTDTRTIQVAAVNDAPVGANANISTAEDTAVSGTLPVATDVDSPSLTYGPGATPPAHGSVAINANGTFTYTPATNYNGPDSFTYTVSDGQIAVEYTVTITVTAENDAPIVNPVTVTTAEDTTLSVTAANGVLAFATDPDGDLLSVSSFSINGASYTSGQVATGGWGSLVLNANGSYTYVPAANYNGAVPPITCTVTDGSASTSSTLTINVTPVNDAPGSTPISAQSASDNQAVSFNISGNFFDVDQGDTRTYAASGLPPGLTINTATGIISGTVDRSASTSGPYTVIITATDTGGLSASRSFTWTITNPAPTARNDAIATTENAAVAGSVLADNGNGADSDPDGDPLVVSAVNGNGAAVGTPVSGSLGGTFIIAANGNSSFDPGTAFDNLAAGATRTTSVTYTISDGQGGFSTATVTVTVTGQNDAPVAVNDTFTTAEDTPVTFDPRTNDSDIDGNALSITQINGSAISVGVPVAVSGGTVTLNANGSPTFTPTANFNGASSFTYTISDGTTTATATVNGTVTPVNDTPVARNDAIATTENANVSGSVFADNGNGVDSDIDGDPLVVSAVNGNGAAVGTPVSGSLGGTFIIAADGAYSFNPGAAFDNLAADQTRTTSITYTISDGQGGTSTATVTVTVTGQNDAPVAVNDTFTTAEDTAVTFDPRTNDSDIDGNALAITQINGSAINVGVPVAVTGGTVTLNANGSLTFAPTANFNGAPSFTYTISDGITTATATVNGTVTSVNDAPTAVNDSFGTAEDTPVTFDPRINDTDIDGNALTVTQINGVNIASGGSIAVQGGTITLNANGTLTFVPVANFNGPVSFSYTISDGAGGVATATVSGVVTAVNDAPVAVDDIVILQEDSTATFDVRGNDSDVEGNALAVVAINGTPVMAGVPVSVSEGIVTLNANGTLTFAPAANFNGQTNFTYTISDGQGGFATATVAVTVEGQNDAPVSTNGSLTTAEDTAFTGTLPAASDADNDPVTYSAGMVLPANGSVVINANGTYTYTPAANFAGTDSFSFVVTDPSGGRNEYTVSVTVTAVNDAPTAGTIPSLSQIEAATVTMPVGGYFSDLDGDTLAFSQTGLPAGLTLDPVTGVISGIIANNASLGGPTNNGVYSVTITAADGNGGTVSTTFTLTITNPAPVANSDTVSTTEDTAVVFNVITGLNTTSGAAGADSDPDGDTIQLISATASHGTVSFLPNGSITYTPNANFNGTDTITYTISDGQGGTASATVTVSVSAANDAPIAAPIVDRTVNDGAMISFDAGAFFSDADGDDLGFTITGLPPGLTYDPATGLISGRITPDASGPTGIASYTVTISATDGNGGMASASFTYTVLNLPPEANNDTATTAEDTPVDIPILANDTDPDGDTDEVIRVNNIVLTVGGPPVFTAHGQVSLVLVGGVEMLRYTPNANYNGQESFTYTIDDRNSGVDTATVTVTVTPVNDAPTAMPIPNQSRTDGQSLAYNVASFFADVDGDTLTYTASGLPPGLGFNPNTGLISGTITADASQHGPGNNGIYTVTVAARDASGANVQTTFTITVTNPAPVAVNDVITIDEDESVEIAPLANDTDPDGDPLTITQANAAHGTVSIVNGVLNYTPNANFNGTDTISYTISDGNGGVSSALITVTINPVNDAPTSRPIATLIDSDGQSVTLDLGPYFSDVDGEDLTFTITGLPPGLIYNAQTGVISGILDDDASVGGPYTVVVIGNDGNGGTSQQSFTWIVRNVSPSASDDLVAVNADGTASGNVLTNDADPDGDPIFVAAVAGLPANVGVAVTGSQGGTFVVLADGSFTFDPGADFDDLPAGVTRVTTITYHVSDGEGDEDTATIIVTVTGVNDAPTAGTLPDQIRVDGDSVDYSIAGFFSDVDGDDIDFVITGLPTGLTYNGETGRITGTLSSNASQGGPNADGIYLVAVTASDGNGGEIQRTYRVTVSNPAPNAVNDIASTSEDVAIDIPVLANDTDPDGDTISIDPTFTPMAGHGTVTINADGTLRYTPNANYNGTDTIIYRITDGQGGISTALVTVTIGAVNDDPVATPLPDTSLNDGDVVSLDVSGNFSDPEGSALTYDVTGLPDGLTFDSVTGVISGTIVSNASGPTGRQDYIVIVTATDGQGGSASVQFTYTIVNLVPQAQGDTVAATEDVPLMIDVLANDRDPDGDAVSIVSVNGTSLTVGGPAVAVGNGTVALVLDGGAQKLLFTPSANYNGSASFTYTIDDGNGSRSSATVTINVGAANDAPTATPIPDRSDLDGRTVNLNIAGYFSDLDGDALSFSQTGLPAGLSLNAATGLISGTIASNASQTGLNGSGSYSVTVTASDGHGASVSTTFTFTIANPAPVAGNDSVLTNEDTPATFNVITGTGTTSGVTGTDSDPDGDTLQLISVSAGNGTVSFLPNGSVTYTPNANFNGTDTLVYTISDGQGGTATATVTVVVTPVNDAPVIDLDAAVAGTGYSTTFTEGGGPVSIAAPTSFIADVENDIVALSLSIGGIGSNGAAELIRIDGNTPLTFGTAASGTVTFGGVTLTYTYDGAGQLQFANAAGTGQAIPATSLTALIRAITYENRSDNPTSGTRSFAFVATDSAGNASATAITSVSVVGVNTAPVATNDSVATSENTAINSAAPGVLGNDSDPEGNALSVVAVAGNAGNVGVAVGGGNGGSFVLRADGSYSFDPGTAFDDLQIGEQRVTSIAYTVSDGNGGTAIATLSVTVNGANDAPTGANTSITTNEDTSLSSVLPAASDVDGDALTYLLVAGPANGALTLNTDGSYSYTPRANYNGPDSFTYTVSDGRTTSAVYTVTIGVAPVEDSPIAQPLPDIALLDGQVAILNVSSAFSDADNDTLGFSATGLPTGLTISAGGVISGTVDRSASQLGGGSYTVIVTANDGKGNTVSQSFTLTVANPAPVAADDTAVTAQNTPTSGNVLANDVDPDGDPLAVVSVGGSAAGVGVIVAGSAGGQFTIAADGTYTFDPGTDFAGLRAGQSRETTISYVTSDAQGGTATALLRITVTGLNDAPLANNLSLVTAEDTAVNGAIIATDPDGDALTYAVAALPANGVVALAADGSFTYTPAADFNGTDSFDVVISDGNGGARTVTVSVTITAVNDAPVGADATISINEDTPFSGTLPRAIDPDGPTLTYAAGSLTPAHGTVTIDAAGNFVYTPDSDFSGTDSFTYTISDGIAPPRTYSVTVQVLDENDSPTATADTAATGENTAVSGNVTANDSDPDGDPLVVIGVGAPSGGVGAGIAGSAGGVFVIAADGTFQFTPNGSFDDLQVGQQRQTSVTYTISDGRGGVATATLTISVTGTNDAPVAGVLPSLAAQDAASVAYNAATAFSDVDDATLSYAASGLPLGLSINPANGLISGTISNAASIGGPASNGIYTVSVTATDAGGLFVTRTFTLTVTNPPPVASNDSIVTQEDAAITGASVAGNDSDPDGEALTYSLVSGPANGTLTFRTDGTYDYRPAANFNGIDSFTYGVSDGQGGFTTATVSITVTPVNDAPVAVDDPGAFAIAENGTATITPLANDSDADGTPLAIVAINGQSIAVGGNVLVTGGSVTLNGDGSLSFVATTGFNGPVSFSYTITDGAIQATATVSGSVLAVNDAPVNNLPGLFSGTEDQPLSLTGISLSDADAGGGTISVSFSVSAGALIATSGGNVVISGSGSTTLVLQGTLADINAYLVASAPIYQPLANATSNVTLTMTTNDLGNSGIGGPMSDTDTSILTFSAVNDLPVVSAPPLAVIEDMPATGAIIATDPDGDALTFSLATPPANGTVTLAADGTYTYTPIPNVNGVDTFSITVNDGHGGIVTVPVSITIAAVNDAPVGSGTAISLIEDGSFAGTLPAALDADGDAVVYALGQQATSGTVSISPDGAYSYIPRPNFFGSDSFSYSVTDGTATAVYIVTITVNPVNDAPVANPAPLVLTENMPATGSLNTFDPDGDPLGYTVTTPPAHGTASLNPDGTYTFTPAPGFTGSDSFTVAVSDGQGAVIQVVVSISVLEANDPPVGADAAIALPEDSTFTGNLPGATDPEGATVTYALAGAASNGTVTVNVDGSYSYTPRANFFGADSFTYAISDGVNARIYTISITVTPVNDAPLANNDTVVMPRDGAITIAVLANDVDPDGDALTITSATAPVGSVIINPNGTLTYVPLAGFAGTVTIAYTVSDGQGAQATALVTVSVLASDDIAVPSSGPTRPPLIEAPGQLSLERVGAPFILDAIRDIAYLGDLSTSLDARLPILSMVNGIDSLNGLAGLPLITGGALPGYDLNRPFSLDRYLAHPGLFNLTDRTLPDTRGFILSMELQSQPADTDIAGGELTTQSVLHGRVLTLQFSAGFDNTDAKVVEFRVLQADGRPRPAWLGRSGRDTVIGEPPIELDEVRLKIIAILADGRSVERNIIVDLSTGEVRPAPQELGWIRPPLFQERFAASIDLADSDIDALGEALL